MTKAAKKSILIGAVLVALEQFSGYFFMIVKTGDIFVESLEITSETAAIYIQFFKIFGILCTMYLVDGVGRKVIISMSSIGVAFGMLIYLLGEQFMETKDFSIVGLSITIFCGAFGIHSLPYVVISEICSSNVSN